ncbi:MAG: permease prefix domain 1-containing protein [Eubacteriales bacterium]|nr:permease prefix domain 1-containing protein [Eubacteriales bacterium]
METIKLYLENMFMNLPNSEKVERAKAELLAMMEDKYNELKAEGKTENEAVGIVISEFGNLNELAEDLGIKDTLDNADSVPKGRIVTMETVKSYLNVTAISARRIAIGVFLCICSPILIVVLSGMSESNMGISENIAAGGGVGVLLVLVAVAVALFVYNGMALSKYEYLQRESFQMEYSVKQYVMQLQDSHKSTFMLHITIGVVLCIIAVVPLIITACIAEENELLICVMVGVLLFIVAVAVLFFITAGMEEGAYRILLQQDEYAPAKKDNKVLQAVGALYWTIVTTAYLLWSFITFDWYISWIIWPIAGVLYTVIEAALKMKNNNGDYHA